MKAPRSLRTKENNFDSPVNCWGKISRLRKIDCEKYGLQEGVCLCVRHLQGEKQKIGSLCCFPKRSEEDQCSGRLTSCPKRLFPVFESVGSVIGSGKLCEKHLRHADSDERITGNKSYVSPRKVIYLNTPQSFLLCKGVKEIAIRLEKSFIGLITIISDNAPVTEMKQSLVQRSPQRLHQTGKN